MGLNLNANQAPNAQSRKLEFHGLEALIRCFLTIKRTFGHGRCAIPSPAGRRNISSKPNKTFWNWHLLIPRFCGKGEHKVHPYSTTFFRRGAACCALAIADSTSRQILSISSLPYSHTTKDLNSLLSWERSAPSPKRFRPKVRFGIKKVLLSGARRVGDERRNTRASCLQVLS